jgi:hypothetical protein
VSARKANPSFKPDPNEADTSSMDEESEHRNVSGRVKFDDRGNAVWEWAMATGAFGRDVSSSTRLRAIDHTGLAIVDDGPPPSETVRTNPLGVKNGYDPYESGKLTKDRAKGGKKDLRKLSEWLKLKKQAEENKKKQDEDSE